MNLPGICGIRMVISGSANAFCVVISHQYVVSHSDFKQVYCQIPVDTYSASFIWAVGIFYLWLWASTSQNFSIAVPMDSILWCIQFIFWVDFFMEFALKVISWLISHYQGHVTTQSESPLFVPNFTGTVLPLMNLMPGRESFLISYLSMQVILRNNHQVKWKNNRNTRGETFYYWTFICNHVNKKMLVQENKDSIIKYFLITLTDFFTEGETLPTYWFVQVTVTAF